MVLIMLPDENNDFSFLKTSYPKYVEKIQTDKNLIFVSEFFNMC